MRGMFGHSYLFGGNAPFIESLYEEYLLDPTSVPDKWRSYFDKLSVLPGVVEKDVPHQPIQESFARLAKQPILVRRTRALADWESMQKQVGVLKIISAYRVLGVRQANLDPLKLNEQPAIAELDHVTHGLNDSDMAMKFNTGSLVAPKTLPLSEIIARLQQTYCGTIGLEYMHISNSEQKDWIMQRFEGDLSTAHYDNETKKHILRQITAAETLERYLHNKYVGQKRFSLEGGESTIAGLDMLVKSAGAQGVHEMVIGMAHRGRLNVLVNILGKLPRDLFAEFEGKQVIKQPSGDVKYHMGFSADVPTDGGPVHISLAFNPSHLEIVNPVVEGSVRARQDRRGDIERKCVLPVLIHGDAAFSGLGVNQGTLNLSQTRGYGTGGTLHIVINNQIGFTTSDVRDISSTMYCTDVAKMVEAPIFHVNGNDPESVCYVIQSALDYRMAFKKDVVVDIVCYRKHGHNESDEPSVTQPLMYKKISTLSSVRALYADRLLVEGVLSAQDSGFMIDEYRAALEKGEHVKKTMLTNFRKEKAIDWSIYSNTHWAFEVDTSVPFEDIKKLTKMFTLVPETIKLHPTVERVLKNRREMSLGKQDCDWGMAETLAYASLLTSGYGVRLSGEDSGRGTFSHRHAVIHDQNRQLWHENTYVPLDNLGEHQSKFTVIDSILNEEAVLAYEYGYSCSAPNQLVIWEAQFGDFANGAQVAVDQFVASGETKWGRLCGLTIILPHGYDGQGPEHSSARLERWLQLCAEHNIQIVMPSEAVQMFHVLRRQMLRPYRKPLVIFMSKKLLRHKAAMNPIESFYKNAFRVVIGDISIKNTNNVKRILLCSGQIYYDLIAARQDKNLLEEIAIVRIEQMYPFPLEQVSSELSLYISAKEIMWVQEEPKNQGAWYQLNHRLKPLLQSNQVLLVSSRPSSASPAVGYLSKHVSQLKEILLKAVSLTK